MARRATRAQVAAFLGARLDDLRRDWKPGDPCASARGPVPTTLLRIEGDVAYLADGTSAHRSKMRRPYDEKDGR
jgi:hypothetical protein